MSIRRFSIPRTIIAIVATVLAIVAGVLFGQTVLGIFFGITVCIAIVAMMFGPYQVMLSISAIATTLASGMFVWLVLHKPNIYQVFSNLLPVSTWLLPLLVWIAVGIVELLYVLRNLKDPFDEDMDEDDEDDEPDVPRGRTGERVVDLTYYYRDTESSIVHVAYDFREKIVAVTYGRAPDIYEWFLHKGQDRLLSTEEPTGNGDPGRCVISTVTGQTLILPYADGIKRILR